MANNSETTPKLYNFYESEREIVDAVVQAIRKSLLSRADITPRQISAVARLLFGLERLPRVTSGVYITIGLAYTHSSGIWFVEMSLNENCVRFLKGGVEKGPMGSDTYSTTIFEVGAGWRGDCESVDEVMEWVENFKGKAEDPSCDLTVESEEIDLDWYAEDDEDDDYYWGLLEYQG